ncbi:MAG: secretin N-terminal domain-containing protein, partial [Lysobacter sp.]
MKFRAIAISLMVVGLASCAATTNLRKADEDIRKTEAEQRSLIDQMRTPQQPTGAARGPSRETVIVSTSQWVDRTPLKTDGRRLPRDVDCNIMFKPLVPMSLLEMAQQISTDCRIPVRVTPDAIVAVNGGGSNGGLAETAASEAMPPSGIRLPNLPNMPGSLGVAAMTMNTPMSPGSLFDIDWNGPVSGLLDLATARNGLAWRYNERTRSISIFYLDTRTFRLDAFPMVIAMQTTIQTGTSSAGGAGGGAATTAGSSQTTTSSMDTSLYADVETTIKSFLTPGTGRMAISPSTGTVSVTDTPEVLERVATMLDRENATLTKQI